MKALYLLSAAALLLAAGACTGKEAAKADDAAAATNTPVATKAAPVFESGVVNELEDPTILEPGTPVNKLTVVDFNAVWCGPCRQLTPVLHDLAKKYDGKVDFVSVDVDKYGELMDAYQLGNSIPAVLILSPKGTSVSYIGIGDLLPAEKFETILNDLLK